MRIDVVLAKRSLAPRSAVAQAIDSGRVSRNGETVVKASLAVVAGDTLDYDVRVAAPLVVEAQDLPLDVIYEDDAIAVVNKAAGMVTHPAHGSRDGTLVNALLARFALPGDPVRPGLVHRLDKDTSGLLVIAKTQHALSTLGKAMQRRFIEREYVGLVAGVPERERGTIEGAIGRDPHARLKFAIRTDGRRAVTHYELAERLAAASELRFRLETGRTHQIRVHLAAFGHPVINDPLYGRRDSRVELAGQALHAQYLRFRHPETRADLSFEAAPPAAYLRAKEALRA